MNLADGLDTINMCVINDPEYDLLYIIDLDGTFRPNPAIAPTVSSLVASDNQMHLTFLNPSKCVVNTVGCYSYCHDTCFRSMRYYVEGSGQESYKLKVCSRTDHSRCSLFKGGRRGDVGPHEFTAHLPSGQLYDAIFLDGDGNEITPSTVSEVVEKTFCTSGMFEVLLLDKMGLSVKPVSPPARVSTPVRPPFPTPVRAPVRQPVSAPAPIAVPVRLPVKVPVRIPIQVPVAIQISSPVQAPVQQAKSIFSSIFSMLFPWLKRK
jgi:hypothetical protein